MMSAFLIVKDPRNKKKKLQNKHQIKKTKIKETPLPSNKVEELLIKQMK
jgi:hypothetical protein